MARSKTPVRKHLKTKGGTFKFDVWKSYRAAKEAGDTKLATKLRNQLVEENRPLAVAEAVKFRRQFARHCDLQDLIQSACIGLLRAIERFDPTQGGYSLDTYDPKLGGFSSYVVRWIVCELRETSLGDFVVKKATRDSAPKAMREKYVEMEKSLGRPPTTTELGANARQVARALDPRPVMVWMDTPKKDGHQEVTMHDFMASPNESAEDQLSRREDEHREFQYLATLPREEHLAVAGRVLEGLRYDEIAKRVSTEEKKYNAREAKALVESGLARMKVAIEKDRSLTA